MSRSAPSLPTRTGSVAGGEEEREEEDELGAEGEEKMNLKKQQTIKIPNMPALSSIGEFALELDRMHLLRSKNPMIHDILDAREGESENEEEEKEEKDVTLSRGLPFSSSHSTSARVRLEEKLSSMFVKGLVSFHGDDSMRIQRVKKRHERSARKSFKKKSTFSVTP